MNYNMHGMAKSVTELHGMLKTAEQDLKQTPQILMVQRGKGKGKGRWKRTAKPALKVKAKPSFKGKGNDAKVRVPKAPKESKCFHCDQIGHWRRNCPMYLEDLKKGRGGTSSGIFVIEVNFSSSSSWVLDT